TIPIRVPRLKAPAGRRSAVERRPQPGFMARAGRLQTDRARVCRVRPESDDEMLAASGGRQALEPLDGRDAPAVQRLAQEERILERRLETVEIGVVQRQAAAPVLGGDDEARAVDCVRIDAESGREPAYQTRLSRAEMSDQAEELAPARGAAEPGAQRLRVL